MSGFFMHFYTHKYLFAHVFIYTHIYTTCYSVDVIPTPSAALHLISLSSQTPWVSVLSLSGRTKPALCEAKLSHGIKIEQNSGAWWCFGESMDTTHWLMAPTGFKWAGIQTEEWQNWREKNHLEALRWKTAPLWNFSRQKSWFGHMGQREFWVLSAA